MHSELAYSVRHSAVDLVDLKKNTLLSTFSSVQPFI
jgi:hypothetical protein